jgi:hypothetical protein
MTSLGSFCTKARTKIISNSGARYVRLSLCILKFDVSNALIPAAAVERRPMKHVRMHLQRRFSPLNQLGKWTSNEDETLIQWVFIKYVTCCSNIIVMAGLSLTWVKSGQKSAVVLAERMQTAAIVIAIVLLIERSAIQVCFCS